MRNRSHLRDLVPKSGATVPAALWSGKWIDIWPLKNRCLRFAAECRASDACIRKTGLPCQHGKDLRLQKQPISGGASQRRGLEHAARSEIIARSRFAADFCHHFAAAGGTVLVFEVRDGVVQMHIREELFGNLHSVHLHLACVAMGASHIHETNQLVLGRRMFILYVNVLGRALVIEGWRAGYFVVIFVFFGWPAGSWLLTSGFWILAFIFWLSRVFAFGF